MSKYKELVAARDRARSVLLQDQNCMVWLYLEAYEQACNAVKDYTASLFGEVVR